MLTAKVESYGGNFKPTLWQRILLLFGADVHVYVEPKKRERIIEYAEGERIIHRSNQPVPLLTGVIVTEDTYPDKIGVVPSWKCDQDGQIYTGGTLFRYSEPLMKILRRLKWWEQWNVLTGGRSHIFSENGARAFEDTLWVEKAFEKGYLEEADLTALANRLQGQAEARQMRESPYEYDCC